MSSKLIALFVLSLIAGAVFIGVGIYFLSSGFLTKLSEANPDADEKLKRKLKFRAKGTGYAAISTGIMTVIWGIFIFIFPQITGALALVYMLFLIAAFSVISFAFK